MAFLVLVHSFFPGSCGYSHLRSIEFDNCVLKSFVQRKTDGLRMRMMYSSNRLDGWGSEADIHRAPEMSK